MASIAAVPDNGRRFDISPDLARRQYGIDGALLEQLQSCGLPMRQRDGALFFDLYDLANASLHLGLSSIQRMAMRTWGRTLQKSDESETLQANIKFLPAAASPTDPPLHELQVPLSSNTVHATGVIRSLLDQFREYRFYMLPEVCRWDMGFIEAHRVCECGGASTLLAIRAKAMGIEARQCFGLLIAEPFSTGHYWTELRIDGQWIAFDPLLLQLLHAVTRLDPDKWPIHRSNAVALHMLCVIDAYDDTGAPVLHGFEDQPGIAQPVVVMDGQTLVVSLPTTFIS
jgi:hypothetical protein